MTAHIAVPALDDAGIPATLSPKILTGVLREELGFKGIIVTDALEHNGVDAMACADELKGKISDWTFNERLIVAEKAGLIRGGCARVPEIARRYRDSMDADGNANLQVTEQDARRSMQVLHVIMRDLDPGR